MAMSQTIESRNRIRLNTLDWSEVAFGLLITTGALLVVVGSYLPWATFYAGLIERNGVPGHGKYLIALAAVALIAGGASHARTLGGLRIIAPVAGIAIGLVALRDLRNLDALIGDPSAAFYVPGKGDGLYIILAGAALLIASFFVAPRWPSPRRETLVPTIATAILIAGAGSLLAGLYGEYYLHLGSGGHQYGHTAPTNAAHVLTFVGAAVLVAASSVVTQIAGSRRRR